MPLILEPVFQERIWGGTNLAQFGYDLPSDHTGEVWEFQLIHMVRTAF